MTGDARLVENKSSWKTQRAFGRVAHSGRFSRSKTSPGEEWAESQISRAHQVGGGVGGEGSE